MSKNIKQSVESYPPPYKEFDNHPNLEDSEEFAKGVESEHNDRSEAASYILSPPHDYDDYFIHQENKYDQKKMAKKTNTKK
ncbi:hypothetical protein TWF694_001154 [Orbilia ellipsospora]|uniref:Uncharacterized protein n=1 Tax=Orbilia ellipsospora TaxID=2528407 RepID=A0AAV9XR72_9PEZI